MDKNIIDKHFSRNNVIAILSIIFGLIIYFGKNAYTAHKEYLSQFEHNRDTSREQIEELRHFSEMILFMKDSIAKSTDERIILYNELVQMVPYENYLKYTDKIVEAKKSILMDIARFSKFKILKKSDKAKIFYDNQVELFSSEKKYIDLLNEISITTPVQQRKYLEDKQGDLLLEHIGEINKNIELRKFDLSLSQKSVLDVKEENLRYEQAMSAINTRYFLYLIITGIFISLWINIFLKAFRKGVFIEKN